MTPRGHLHRRSANNGGTPMRVGSSFILLVRQAGRRITLDTMDLLKSMPEGTVGATWPTFYKPGAFVLLLYVTAIGTNLNWIFGQIS